MLKKKPSLIARWMITPLEVVVIVAVIVLTLGGLFLSIQDALQLEEALNLDLTQTLIVTQGIVNLQREVLLTHAEVLRLLRNLDQPPKPITRYDFIEIQVNNLSNEAASPSTRLIFKEEDLALVQTVQNQSADVGRLIDDWQRAETSEGKTDALKGLDARLDELENTVKQMVDRQATAQRGAIVQTKESLLISQRTSVFAGAVVLLMSFVLAAIFRRTLSIRLHQAVESDRMKSQLLANVSHELRTPLNAIQGYSQFLSEEAYGALTKEQQNTIQRIRLNTTQLQGMVNNLLDRAQIEQGKLSLRNAPFSPADLLETTHTALNILAVTKSIELTFELAPDVPASIIGDPLRLQQILQNLVSNAIKFTESGSVRARIFLPDQAHWTLQVIDTGMGMPLEAQAHVFESFWQIDSSATRHHRGSGLGLAIVKQLADLMGGQITLTSQPGQGSTFTIVFPLERA